MCSSTNYLAIENNFLFLQEVKHGGWRNGCSDQLSNIAINCLHETIPATLVILADNQQLVHKHDDTSS